MLTDQQVIELREAYASGQFTIFSLAERYGIGSTTAWDAIRGETFKSLAGADGGGVESPNRRILVNVRRVRRLVDRWIRIRETPLSPPGGIWVTVSAGEVSKTGQLVRIGPGPAYVKPYTPSDPLCWALTFEIILKTLTRHEYRALASWYVNYEQPNATALGAIRKVDMERARRNFR